ncbi:MAG TPA: M56 family metallopeptidase, partial [Pirellulales bacterium]
MNSLGMNSLGIMAVWGIVQVSAVALVALASYALVRKRGPAARSHVAATSLGVTLLVAVLAISPWPKWISVSPGEQALQADPQAMVAEQNVATIGQDAAAENDGGDSAAKVAKKAPNSVDVAATFWQTLLRELAEPPAADAGRLPFSWPAAVAAALAVALALGALRLLVGLWGVRQLRAGSRPVADRLLLEEVDRLRRVMGYARSIEIRASSKLASPVTIGWRRASIILPADWDGWNDGELRTALAHEMAHIVRGDYAAGLLAQFCVAANYYHPLVHWLAHRLRLEQELAADADAATVIGSRGEYLLTLAQLALRCDDRPIAWAARPFLPARGALSRRIEMLRDARQVFTRPFSGGLRVTIVAGLVGVGILAAGVRGPGNLGGAATAAEPPGKVPLNSTTTVAKLPFDLSQIPPESQVIFAVRPALIFKQKALAPIAALINQGDFVVQIGAPIEGVEELILAANILVAKKGERAPAALGGGTIRLVLRMKAPIDRAKFRHAIQPVQPEPEEVAGKKLYPAGTPEGLSHFFLNDTTVVLGELEDLRSWLKSGEKKNWGPAGWEEVAQGDAALWLDVKRLRGGLTEMGPLAGMMGAFEVLWQQTDSLIAGANLDDSFKLHAKAQCTSPENAERIQKTLEAAITLATNSVAALDDVGGKNGPDAGQLALMKSATRLLGQVKLSRKESTVETTVEAPLDSLATFAAVAPAVSTARQAARRAQSVNNLKMLSLAMHIYAASHSQSLPPAVLFGPDGKTPHSWRVALLPYLEQNALYKEYKLDEPWDSENNKKVLAKMPAVFRCPEDNPNSTNSSYFAVVGPKTLF